LISLKEKSYVKKKTVILLRNNTKVKHLTSTWGGLACFCIFAVAAGPWSSKFAKYVSTLIGGNWSLMIEIGL
jgi:hypothetical protein